MAVLEQINSKKNVLLYRISEEYALCQPQVCDTLEQEVQAIHESQEVVTKETLAISGRERA